MIGIGKWLERCGELPELPIIHENKYISTNKQPEIKNKASLKTQSKKLDFTLLTKSLASQIKVQTLSLGWTPAQLQELEQMLPVFVPYQIGLVTLRSICIELLHSDGSIRGAVTHYNHEVDQPWLKHLKKGGGRYKNGKDKA